jgi:hypothetical protein
MAVDPLLFKYKGDRCAYCGLTVEEMLNRFGVVNKVFQFNHIDPAKKHPNYNNLIQRIISIEQLDELDKCVLLCNNCHDVLHAQQGMQSFFVQLVFGDRVIERWFKGQAIIDMERHAVTFFSDKPYLMDV